MKITKDHFKRAALEIGQSGDNDTLPYDIEGGFLRDEAEELSVLCAELFNQIENKAKKDAISFLNELHITSERLLVPSGSYGFRVTTKINTFWNLYLNGLALALAEANEPKRSARVYSYRLGGKAPDIFDRSSSWRAYKEATISDPLLQKQECMVVQTDISSFYERVYHHRLENVIGDIVGEASTIPIQIDRILNKLSAGRSFGLPVGGQCARILAEIMMNPIDDSLSEDSINWYRYVDDFTLICRTQYESYKAISQLSLILANYGLSLNRTKTTMLSANNYKEFVESQLGNGDPTTIALRELDLHFDPYSDEGRAEYEHLKSSFKDIDVKLLLDLEKEKSNPDTFVLAQIGRALKFQDPAVAIQLCETLLEPKNLDAFRASWPKIMRGVFSIRSNEEFAAIFEKIDDLLDKLPTAVPHLLTPEANILHYLRALRFCKSESRSKYVKLVYKESSSTTVKRACIDCWSHWKDRHNFNSLRNEWPNLSQEEQRMFWIAAEGFGDEGSHAKNQLRRTLSQTWNLGFDKSGKASFSTIFQKWADNRGS